MLLWMWTAGARCTGYPLLYKRFHFCMCGLLTALTLRDQRSQAFTVVTRVPHFCLSPASVPP